LTIPVSLVGTFAVISVFGFSINTLTLFGLVLAIGIVVDDAIVVVENTQRHLDEERLASREATRRATAEVVGPVIATALVLLALSGAGYFLLRTVPTGFAPTEDQGYLLVNVQLPDAASLERTDAVVRQIEKILLETPGVETVVAIGGRSFITGVNGPNVGSLFPRLTPWSKRKTPELQAGAILARLRARLGSIQEAVVVVFPPPPIRGISSGGGFQFELQSVAGGSLMDLDAT